MGDGSPTWGSSAGMQGPGAPRSLFVRVLSVIWALAPLFTVGLATPACFTYAAVRLRSRSLGWCAAAYWVILIAAVSLVPPWAYVPDSSWRSSAQGLLTWLLILAGTTQAFVIRRALLEGPQLRSELGPAASASSVGAEGEWPEVPARGSRNRDE